MTETIVLVHGAWHGGWCWDRVRPVLEAAGFSVITPTLPGLEADAHYDMPPSLEDHVSAIVREIEQTNGRVLLVGHSYGGMVVTGAADRTAGRLSGVVYLDAAVPKNGESFASHIPGIDAEGVSRREVVFRQMAGGGDWLPPPPFEMIGITDEVDKGWLQPQLRAHPLRTWLDAARLTRPALGVPLTYAVVTNPPTTLMGYPAHAAAFRAAGWPVHEIATGHELMVTAADETAAIILGAARA